MNEGNFFDKESRQEVDLDQRLSAYYGPPLREQPLVSSSWQALCTQLPLRRSFKRQLMYMFRRRPTRRDTVPTFIQDAFAHIAYEAQVPYTSAMLASKLRFTDQIPHVQVSLLRRHPIRLILPLHVAHSMEPSELDVLLATGLARYLCMRKPAYAVSRLLLSGIVPLLCVLLALLLLHGISHFMLLIATILCLGLGMVTLWLLHRQGRNMAFRADVLIVLWLGRGRACQGLHALAAHKRGSMHKLWSEPTLAERIERVCGVQIAVEQERLTLVR
jgi:hypothetical protein